MTSNQLATAAALAVAALAVYVVIAKPRAARSGQPGESSKADQLQNWFEVSQSQWALFGGQAMPTSAQLTGF
jgi:hypothetical protein